MIPHDKFIDKIKQYIDEKKLFSFGDHVIMACQEAQILSVFYWY